MTATDRRPTGAAADHPGHCATGAAADHPVGGVEPARLDEARRVASAVQDPELPMLTLADLGVLRAVEREGETVVISVTPTYSGCPALATMRADLQVALRRAGFERVEIRTTLSPAWSSDWISEHGRAALAAHGIAPPGPAAHARGPVPLTLSSAAQRPACPQCGSPETAELSRFGATACRSLHVCGSCGEPFDHVKAI